MRPKLKSIIDHDELDAIVSNISQNFGHVSRTRLAGALAPTATTVGQTLKGERPITEKKLRATIKALETHIEEYLQSLIDTPDYLKEAYRRHADDLLADLEGYLH